MKKKILSMFLVLGFLLLWACSKDSTPTAPPTPQIPDCERYHTAQIAFENRSNSNTTYDIYWDGAKKTTLAPGIESQVYTEATGTHSLQFVITNTQWIACQSSPVLAECQSYGIYCSY